MSALPTPAGRTWPGWQWTRARRRSPPRPGGRRTGRTRRRRCRRTASGRSAGRGRAPPATTRAVTPSRRRRWRRSCGDAGASRTGCAGYSTRCSGRTTAGRGPGEAAAGGRGVTRAGSGQGADADQAAQGRVGRRRPVAGSPGNPGPRSAVALRSVVRRISPIGALGQSPQPNAPHQDADGVFPSGCGEQPKCRRGHPLPGVREPPRSEARSDSLRRQSFTRPSRYH